MSILHDLYQGDIAPFIRPIKSDKYTHLTEKIAEAENWLEDGLSEDKRKQYEKHTELLLARESLVHEEMFIEGFKACAKIIIEALTRSEG